MQLFNETPFVFQPLLKLLFSFSEPNINKFNRGDKVLLWTVTDKNHNEILLEWQSSGWRGCTYFQVTPDKRHLMFGSSIGKKNTWYQTRLEGSPLGLVEGTIDLLKNNPHQLSLSKRLEKSVSNISQAGIIGIHQFYSRLLLISTLRTLVLEQT